MTDKFQAVFDSVVSKINSSLIKRDKFNSYIGEFFAKKDVDSIESFNSYIEDLDINDPVFVSYAEGSLLANHISDLFKQLCFLKDISKSLDIELDMSEAVKIDNVASFFSSYDRAKDDFIVNENGELVVSDRINSEEFRANFKLALKNNFDN